MSTRTLQLADQTLSYLLKRSARRTIGLKITREGLSVTLPRQLPESEAERAILQKLPWILDKLADQQYKPAGPVLLACGQPVLWLGETRLLQTGSTRTRLQDDVLLLAAQNQHEHIAQSLTRFYQSAARTHFGERVRIWSERMGLAPTRLGLSSARGRWGSCSSNGAMRLNWRLMQAPLAVIEYVVIHELAHLAELNHSARFWAIVAAHCPAWKQQRDWLKLNGHRLMGW